MSYPSVKAYPNNTFDSVFNISDFSYLEGYATLNDLMSYANLYLSNVFTQTQYFTSIYFTTSINGINSSTLEWVTNLATYDYDGETNSVSIDSNVAIGGSLAVNNINSTNLVTQTITTDTIDVQNMTCNNLHCNNIINVFLFSNSITYPLSQSGNISNLTNIQLSSLYITLAAGVIFILQDNNGIVVYSITNSTNDFIHYRQITYNPLYTPTRYKIYYLNFL